jgi:hypothetical protein
VISGRLGSALLFLGALLPALALLASLVAGEEVTILARARDAEERAEQRRIRDPRDDPAEIYGVPEPGAVRVVFPRPDRRILPPEAPGRVLLVVDRLAGDRVLLARTMLLGALGAGGALAGVGWLLRRRGSKGVTGGAGGG